MSADISLTADCARAAAAAAARYLYRIYSRILSSFILVHSRALSFFNKLNIYQTKINASRTMKGQRELDHKKHVEAAKTLLLKDRTEKTSIMGFTYLDLVPLEFNRTNVMDWLANTGWIEGLTIKYVGDQFPYLDDYIQEMYLLIFDKIDKLIDIYETRGILAFCSYIKTIVFTNCFAQGAQTYKKIREFSRDRTISCTDEMWNNICDTYDPDSGKPYHFNKTNQLI